MPKGVTRKIRRRRQHGGVLKSLQNLLRRSTTKKPKSTAPVIANLGKNFLPPNTVLSRTNSNQEPTANVQVFSPRTMASDPGLEEHGPSRHINPSKYSHTYKVGPYTFVSERALSPQEKTNLSRRMGGLLVETKGRWMPVQVPARVQITNFGRIHHPGFVENRYVEGNLEHHKRMMQDPSSRIFNFGTNTNTGAKDLENTKPVSHKKPLSTKNSPTFVNRMVGFSYP